MSKYRKLSIFLNERERKALTDVVRKGISSSAEIRRANVLLMADRNNPQGWMKDVDIAKALGITNQAIHDIKSRFIGKREDSKEESEVGLCIERKKRETPPVPAKCTGDIEARITALACSSPPEGHGKWTLRLLSERSVELQIIDSISHTQVGRIRKKTGLSLT